MCETQHCPRRARRCVRQRRRRVVLRECELIDRRTFKRRDQARLEVFGFIERFYNPRRRHSALGYVSPNQFEEKEGMIKQEVLAAVAV